MKHQQRLIGRLLDARDHGHSDSDLLCGHAVHSAHNAGPFLQVDQDDVVRLFRRTGMNDRHRIDDPTPRGFDPLQRLPVRTRKARREIGLPAFRIALEKQAPLGQRCAPMGFGRNRGSCLHMAELLHRSWPVNRAGPA